MQTSTGAPSALIRARMTSCRRVSRAFSPLLCIAEKAFTTMRLLWLSGTEPRWRRVPGQIPEWTVPRPSSPSDSIRCRGLRCRNAALPMPLFRDQRPSELVHSVIGHFLATCDCDG